MDSRAPTLSPSSPPAFGAIILAAGGSSRMGRPKQLLRIDGVPLVKHAADAALASLAWPVVVVLGNAAPIIQPTLARLPLLCVVNAAWNTGIGSSLQLGIQTLNKYSSACEGAIVLLADQPNLSADAINAIAKAGREIRSLAAARYDETLGSPAYFPRSFFGELLDLAPAEGAQKILRRNATQVIAIDRPELSIDLDTPEEFQRYLESKTGLDNMVK